MEKDFRLDDRQGRRACAYERMRASCFAPLDEAASAAVITDWGWMGATMHWTDDAPCISVALVRLLAVWLSSL
jgi:hypothetical protein